MIKKLNTEGMEKIAGGSLEVKYVGSPNNPRLAGFKGALPHPLSDPEYCFAVVDTETGNWVNWNGMQYPADTDMVRVPVEMAKYQLESAKQRIAEGYNGPFIAFGAYSNPVCDYTIEPSNPELHATLHQAKGQINVILFTSSSAAILA